MIYFYVESNSYMGTTTSGITFSSTGVVVNGVSGSSVLLSSITKSGPASYVGDSTPIVFIDTDANFTNYSLPDSPVDGTTIFIRRTDTLASGTTGLYAGGDSVIRERGNSVGLISIDISPNSYRCFFYDASSVTWWEF